MKRICQYCRRFGWETTDGFMTSNGAVRDELCRCGKRHRCCDGCFRTRARILGDFPHQAQKMPECPPRQPGSKVAHPPKSDA